MCGYSDLGEDYYDDYNTVNYGVVDNNTISFISGYYNGSTFKSTRRHMVYDDGWLLPTGFIDWSRSPESYTETVTSETTGE